MDKEVVVDIKIKNYYLGIHEYVGVHSMLLLHTWVDTEDILSEINQMGKDMISFLLKINQIHQWNKTIDR